MKTFQGTIISLKNLQTASVLVERKWQHPLYQKFVKRSKKFACHYQDLTVAVGDKVVIAECQPISKTKTFKIIKRVEDKS